jgi:hypothetical protein
MFDFTINMDRKKVYCEYKGNISNLLNTSLHESLNLECVITLITFFWSLKIFSLCGWFPQKMIPKLVIECTYAKYTILKVSVDIIGCIVWITKHDVFNLDIMWSIWAFHDRESSMIKPKNLVCDELLTCRV